MSYPGRVGSDCASCGAEMQEVGSGVLRCPWAAAGEIACGRPYGRPERDQGTDYMRDQLRKKARRA